jgi:hemerythrin-like domain-containing protein
MKRKVAKPKAAPTKPRKADSISRLMREHDDLLAQLKRLSTTVRALSQDGCSTKALKNLSEIIQFLNHEVRVHNRKEESIIFPVLDRYVEGPTGTLRKDHRELEKGVRQLVNACTVLQNKPDSFIAIKKFSQIARRVGPLFINHINKENYLLFPLLQRFMTHEGLRGLTSQLLD